MNMRTLAATAGNHHYVFRYAPGQEDRVVDEVMRLADDPDTPFGWSDAARMCFQAVHTATQDGCPVGLPMQKNRP
ncbi:MAG: hypothetical protein ACP5HU_06010 [Phycisphaerae bacterium]